MSSIIDRLGGVVPAVLGFSVLFIPMVTMEVTVLSSVVPIKSYNLIELLDVLQELEKDFLYVKLSSLLLVIGSVLSLGTIIRKNTIATLGIFAQSVSAVIFYTQFLNSEGKLSLVSVSPEIGFYAIIVAPIVGLIVLIYPSSVDESEDESRVEKDVYEKIRRNK